MCAGACFAHSPNHRRHGRYPNMSLMKTKLELAVNNAKGFGLE